MLHYSQINKVQKGRLPMIQTKDYQELYTYLECSPKHQELLRQLNVANEMTLSRISHELKNALTLISGSTQLLSIRHPEIKDFKEWRTLLYDIDSAEQLLDELSSYNHSGSLTVNTFHFGNFLKHLCLSFAASLSDSDTEFTSRISEEMGVFRGDRVKLLEAFLNILRNASDAACGGKILLEALRTSDKIEVIITDNGCGMEPEQLEHIFEPFATFKENGTGIGLAISERIIHAHGGDISVKSKLSEGTVFVVSLPIYQNRYEKTANQSSKMCKIVNTAACKPEVQA